MTTFVETQFPPDISYGSKGGSGFNTSVFETASGFEQRNIQWSKSKGEWDIGYGVRNKSDMDVVVNFFMAMRGRAYSFRFKDWADFQIYNQQIGIGDGGTLAFQIVKTYTAATQTFTRNIVKPVAGTITTVLVNGTPVSSSTWSVDTTSGILTFGTGHAPASSAAVVIPYGEFDVPARFDVDKLDVSQDYYNAENWQGIKIVETRDQ